VANQRSSFRVPDLTPRDRPELHGLKFRYVFVAESPHVSEIEPEVESERRPLCGAAGKVWWNALSEALESKPNENLSLEYFLKFCRKHRIAIANAVQVPLDPKVMRLFPKADPMRTLGFSKELGPNHFKKAELKKPLADLRKRLEDPGLKGAKIVALGNDADWFVRAAIDSEDIDRLYAMKLAHPSAWWRRGGYFGRVSREGLQKLFELG
jgi:hypothetical protein